jgi:hypothetical protein
VWRLTSTKSNKISSIHAFNLVRRIATIVSSSKIRSKEILKCVKRPLDGKDGIASATKKDLSVGDSGMLPPSDFTYLLEIEQGNGNDIRDAYRLL